MSWDTFGVMGRITDIESNHIHDAARLPKWYGYNLKTSSLYYPESNQDRLYTLNLSGTNSLINAKKLKEIGGFNELFSTFDYSILELSLRAWQLKWLCFYEHEAICQQNNITQNDLLTKPKKSFLKKKEPPEISPIIKNKRKLTENIFDEPRKIEKKKKIEDIPLVPPSIKKGNQYIFFSFIYQL